MFALIVVASMVGQGRYSIQHQDTRPRGYSITRTSSPELSDGPSQRRLKAAAENARRMYRLAADNPRPPARKARPVREVVREAKALESASYATPQLPYVPQYNYVPIQTVISQSPIIYTRPVGWMYSGSAQLGTPGSLFLNGRMGACVGGVCY